MNELSPVQKNELRLAVLRVLAVRHPSALTARQIAHRAAAEVDFAIRETDVVSALELLRSLTPPDAEAIPDPLGATLYWRATGNGVIALERRHNMIGKD